MAACCGRLALFLAGVVAVNGGRIHVQRVDAHARPDEVVGAPAPNYQAQSYSLMPRADWRSVLIVLVSVGVAASAGACCLLWKRFVDSGTLEKWREAAELIASCAEELKMQEEVNLAGFKLPFVVNMILLGRVQQADEDPKHATAVKFGPVAQFSEAAHYMRFASAAYGSALMIFFGLVEMKSIRGRDRSGHLGSPEEVETDCICEHCGIGRTDLRMLATQSLDLTGDADCLRHLLAVDHATRSVVLALRGTASISDVVHDAVAQAVSFCGGKAHAGMAAMAKAVWAASGQSVLDLLRENAGYSLVITGHSLGAGTAGLLTILLYHLQRKHDDPSLPAAPSSNVEIRGFCFAPPPVFAPLDKAPKRAIESISIFIYGEDCIPFLSVRAGRELFAALHAIDEVSSGMKKQEVFRAAVGKVQPPGEMEVKARVLVAGLANREAAPELFMPAKTFVWMRPLPGCPGKFDAKECDTKKLAEAVLGGVPLGSRHLADHMTDGYEAALDMLASDTSV